MNHLDRSNKIRFVSVKNQETIVEEWDKIAPIRKEQLSLGNDLSYSRVLEPWILNRLQGAQKIIDIGCGTGRLAMSMAKTGRSVTGIDPSPTSIQLAKLEGMDSAYEISTAEEWTHQYPDYKYDVAVANMVLMDALDLDGICSAIATLARGGRFLATITHPAFWPIYWGYEKNDGYSYSKELIVEAPFKTNSYDYTLHSTHVHRPLSQYFRAFKRAGISIIRFEELRGTEAIKVFPFPRFVAIEATIAAC